jgi:hypothetical protein
MVQMNMENHKIMRVIQLDCWKNYLLVLFINQVGEYHFSQVNMVEIEFGHEISTAIPVQLDLVHSFPNWTPERFSVNQGKNLLAFTGGRNVAVLDLDLQ